MRAGSRGPPGGAARPPGAADGARVVPIAGDLAQPGLGVSEEDLLDAARRGRPLLPPGGDLRHDRRRRGAGDRQRRGHPPRGRARRARSRPAASTRSARSPPPASTRASGARTCSRRPRSSTPIPTSAPSTSPSGSCARSATGPWRVYRPGIVVGDSRTGRDRQGRRALLLLQAVAAGCAGCCPPGCRRSASKAARSTSSRSTTSPTAIDHIAHEPRPRRPGLPASPIPNPKTRGRGDQPLRPRRRRAAGRRCGSTRAMTDPATALVRDAGCASSRRRSGSAKAGLGRARHPGRGPHLRQLPDPLRLDATPRRRWRAPASRCRRWSATPTASGTTGSATSIPTSSRTASLRGAVRGQGGADHRRLLGDRQGGRGQGRRRRRAPCCWSRARSRSWRRPSARSRPPAASPTSTAATCPTSRTSSGWPRRSSPTTARSTSSSTTPAARSAARSALAYDRFHDYERTMQLNYLGALRLILALLPSMRGPQVGPHHQHQLDRRRRPTRRASRPTSRSKAALDAFSRVIASEVVDDGVHITTIHMPLRCARR